MAGHENERRRRFQRLEPTAELDTRFDAAPAAASGARAALSALDGKLDPHVLEDLRLLVSELVTNSIKHFAHQPPPVPLCSVDGQAVEDPVRDEAAVRRLPRSNVDGADRGRIVLGGVPHLDRLCHPPEYGC